MLSPCDDGDLGPRCGGAHPRPHESQGASRSSVPSMTPSARGPVRPRHTETRFRQGAAVDLTRAADRGSTEDVALTAKVRRRGRVTLVDANVLLNAINRSAPDHHSAKGLARQCAGAAAHQSGFAWAVLLAVVAGTRPVPPPAHPRRRGGHAGWGAVSNRAASGARPRPGSAEPGGDGRKSHQRRAPGRLGAGAQRRGGHPLRRGLRPLSPASGGCARRPEGR